MSKPPKDSASDELEYEVAPEMAPIQPTVNNAEGRVTPANSTFQIGQRTYQANEVVKLPVRCETLSGTRLSHTYFILNDIDEHILYSFLLSEQVSEMTMRQCFTALHAALFQRSQENRSVAFKPRPISVSEDVTERAATQGERFSSNPSQEEGAAKSSNDLLLSFESADSENSYHQQEELDSANEENVLYTEERSVSGSYKSTNDQGSYGKEAAVENGDSFDSLNPTERNGSEGPVVENHVSLLEQAKESANIDEEHPTSTGNTHQSNSVKYRCIIM